MTLRASTGSTLADQVIADVVDAYASKLPGAVRGVYVAGSYAEGLPVPASDIDVVAVLREDVDQELAREIANACASSSPIRLDLVPVTAAGLAADFLALVPSFKYGTLLMSGADVRDELPLPSLDAFAAAWAERGRRFMARIRRSDTISVPLEYPDPDGEFYGYDRATITEWYPPGTMQSTKELVAIVGSAATALVALQGGAYVSSKGKCAALYAEHVDDEWTDVVRQVHALCRERFHYMIPEAQLDRATLRGLASQVLAFEQHALIAFGQSGPKRPGPAKAP